MPRFVFMRLSGITVIFCIIFLPFLGQGQRNYAAHSVLSSGDWYKLSVQQPGIYKIDIAFLQSLGLNASGIPSSSIRLFGNGGQMLPEANNSSYLDDLRENAIKVIDGGDGIFNGPDYFLFYSNGPDSWLKDSINRRFNHKKNIYSDRAYYYININANGKRVPVVSNNLVSNQNVTSYNGRLFHELDSVNFLSSGKEWYGEELANLPGKSLTRQFSIPIPGLQLSSAVTIRSEVVARSAGIPSRFDLRMNNQLIGAIPIGAINGGIYDPFAQLGNAFFNATNINSPLSLQYNFIPGSFNAQAWINWFEIFYRSSLTIEGNQLLFRDWESVGSGNIARFNLSNATSATRIWDITDPLSPVEMEGNLSGNTYQFINTAERLKEYIAFDGQGFLIARSEGKVTNQDLHNVQPTDYIIVTTNAFKGQAERLANFHRQNNGLRVIVVTTDAIFNEFGSGNADPVAIRDFLKMYYDRFAGSPADRASYLLLFGDGSFDYKNRIKENSNFVPAWESANSLDPLQTYTSDDFFGFLDDNEDINTTIQVQNLDLGIGRIPSATAAEATNFVDKLIAYHDTRSLGPWRNNLSFIADDEDQNLHLQDAEIISSTVATTTPYFNLYKFYLDAFQQESGAGGSHYPQANFAINNQVFNGTLIWNYNGHGGSSRLAEEVVLDQETVNNWNNPYRLPLFITATCDFAPFDNPLIKSLGENILLRPKTGGIALMTTTRPVFAFSNRIMNNNYLQFAVQPDATGKYKSLGSAVREAKNYTYQTSSDIINNRKFMLLGDPALTLGFPKLKMRLTKINGFPLTVTDTLKAMEKVEMEGEITDFTGNPLPGFNGTVYPIVFDKPQTIRTLGNDPGSPPTVFQLQANAIYKGKASVQNGRFTFQFKVPRDINYQFGKGKISLYAENGITDGNGVDSSFLVGGAGVGVDADQVGPEIRVYLNDERFVNGGISNEKAVLIVKLSDSSGINTMGAGIGHDIVATLDNDNNRFFLLNDFYQSDLDSYQSGSVRFQLPDLAAGSHTLKIKAWDVMNNSSEKVLEFTVVKDEALTLAHVLNYPNPFTTSTTFWFEHNKPGQDLHVRLQIFTVAGKIIKMIEKTINTTGNRSSDLEWNGRDEYGDKPARGVYIYKLSVTAPGNQKKEKIEKMVLF